MHVQAMVMAPSHFEREQLGADQVHGNLQDAKPHPLD